MPINQIYLWIIFIIINIRSFRLMQIDKKRSIQNTSRDGKERIPEAVLFLNSLLAGFVGICVGMIWIRHKIQKPYFRIGVAATTIFNVLLFFLLKEKLEEDFGFQFYYNFYWIASLILYFMNLFE